MGSPVYALTEALNSVRVEPFETERNSYEVESVLWSQNFFS